MKTIVKASEGIYKEKGSKFISFAIPVQDAGEIKPIIEKYRKTFYDARHVCYAYMFGEKKDNFRAYDDGEPSGTAGRPILGQIQSFELTDILVIVVRYFGGILLGTGRLTTAYKEAAADAIRNAEIIEKQITAPLAIHFEYTLMNEVSRIIKEYDLPVSDQKFESDCRLTLEIPQDRFDTVKRRFEKIYGVEIE